MTTTTHRRPFWSDVDARTAVLDHEMAAMVDGRDGLHRTHPNLTPADVPPAEYAALVRWSIGRAAEMTAAGYVVSADDIAAAVLGDPDSIDDAWSISPWWRSVTIWRDHPDNETDPRFPGGVPDHFETVPPRKLHTPRTDGTLHTFRRMRLMPVQGRTDRTADGRPLSAEMAVMGRLVPDGAASAWDAYNAVRAAVAAGLVPALDLGDEDQMPYDPMSTHGMTEDGQPGHYAIGDPRDVDHVSEGWRKRELPARTVTPRHIKGCPHLDVDEDRCSCNYRTRTRKDGTVAHDHRPTCSGRGVCACRLTWRITEHVQDLDGDRTVTGRRVHRVGAPAADDVVSAYRRTLPAAERVGRTIGADGVRAARKRGKRASTTAAHPARTARASRRAAALAAIDALSTWEGWTITVDTAASRTHAAVLRADSPAGTLTGTRRDLATALATQ